MPTLIRIGSRKFTSFWFPLSLSIFMKVLNFAPQFTKQNKSINTTDCSFWVNALLIEDKSRTVCDLKSVTPKPKQINEWDAKFAACSQCGLRILLLLEVLFTFCRQNKGMCGSWDCVLKMSVKRERIFVNC